ncbi:SAM and PH domain-containing protein [Aspergillus undulatus]|uniref:SAM and PH domain-containing protein n=1 Tax=Aspergillus undulatus TaxID=1810928 RepID=UPI003CCE1E00
MSNTTDFADTDFEYSDDEEESPRVSMGSFGYDSRSSLTTLDPPTPDQAIRQHFTFENLDKMTKGPSGPHLFRSSVGSQNSVPSAEVDLYFERSPVRTQFTQSEASEPPSSAEPTPSNKYMFSPCTPKAYVPLHPDVSQVSEQEIRDWTPSQVAHWMHIGGYDESVINKFLINDITGTVLLTLQTEDLKELGIKSFGKRHQVIGSIDHLRNTMLKGAPRRPESRSDTRSLSPSKQRSYVMSVSPTGEILSGFENHGGQDRHVSIVGIEQVLPKPHNCSKGENCPKYRRRQRQIEKLAAEYPEHTFSPAGDALVAGNPGNPITAQNLLRPTSDAQPSVAASSDVFGAMQTPRLCAEALNEVSKLDPQESIRHFLTYQGVEPPSGSDSEDSMAHSEPVYPERVRTPKTAPAFLSRGKTMSQNLRTLPKLTIPVDSDSDELTTAVTTAQPDTTIYGSPTATQQYGPFTGAQYMPSNESYRQGTPFTEADVPVTAIPEGPISRDTSQSVPPNMQYGNLMFQRQQQQEPFMRSASTRPRANSNLNKPLPRVREGKPLTPIENPSDLQKTPRIPAVPLHGYNSALSSDPDVTKSGWMKKRKPARFLRHDWQDAHFTLRGTNLAMHKDELAALRHSRALDLINVDDYTVACSSVGTNSKLTAAFKKSVLRSGANSCADDAAFAFSLVPASKENEKKMLFSSNKGDIKSHHFAVKTRDERIDWMRELMLAKALKKGKEGGAEMQVNGNFI